MNKRTGPRGPEKRAGSSQRKTETARQDAHFDFAAVDPEGLRDNLAAIVAQGALISFTSSRDLMTIKAQILHGDKRYAEWFRKPEALDDWLSSMAIKVSD